MCLSSPTLSESINLSLSLPSLSQSDISTGIYNLHKDFSNHEDEFLELSHPPLSQYDYEDFHSLDLWREDASVDEENDQHMSDISSQLSELSLETSPSLRSDHLPTNQRVSSLYYSMQLIQTLSLSQKKQIISATYSDRAQKFLILDHAGIISWNPESNQQERVYLYPPYKHNLFLEISFSSKYNVYFVLTKARVILIFNSHFEQVSSTRCFENSLLHILFLNTRSLLIGAGVNGVSFWTYKKVDVKSLSSRNRSIKSIQNYILHPSGLTKIPGNKLIRKITLSQEKKWIFALSFYDVYVISYEGHLIKSFLDLHKQTITDCLYSTHYSFLLTVSADSTLALWSDSGFQIHVFNSAMKSNTAVIQHPLSPHLVIVSTVKGFIKCYNLFTLEEEFTQYIMEYPILKIDCFEMSKLNVFYPITTQSISLFDLNYFCEFWGPLGNSLASICFYRGVNKSERFHALCQDGTVRIYSISESRPLSVVLPPPDITFPTSSGSVAYDRNSNLLYILLAPQEIWVYTAKTHPACRLEVYTREVLWSILSARDPETGNFVATGISSHSFIPHCTCLHILPAAVKFTVSNGSKSTSVSNLLMIGLKDGRIVFVTTVQDFSKLFEMQASVGELISLQFLESNQIISQSVSVGGFIIKIWSLPDLALTHSLELHDTLVVFWKVQDIMLAGFSDGTLSLSYLKGMGSSFGGRSEVDESDKTDEIISIHGIERFNLFCTAQKSGVVKIWDHHKNLIKVITLNASLDGAYFLNTNGDLLVCLNRHFYIIKHEFVLSSVSLIQAADSSNGQVAALTDSDIFEDPNCKNGELVATKHGLYYVDTMESYLKPYDIDLHGPNGLAILDQMLEDNVQDSNYSSLSQSCGDTITALTSQVFLSDIETPLMLSLDDFPCPIFSTPTVTPSTTPPPPEIDEKEVIRAKLSSLKQSDACPIVPLDSTDQQNNQLEQPTTIQSVRDERVATIREEELSSISKAPSPNFVPETSFRRVPKTQIIRQSKFENIPKVSEPESKQVTVPSDDIPISTKIIPKILTRRKTVRKTNKNSELLRSGIELNSLVTNTAYENATIHDIPRLEDTTLSRESIIKSLSITKGSAKGRDLSNGITSNYTSHHGTDQSVDICNASVEQSQDMTKQPVHLIDSNLSASIENKQEKLASLKKQFNKVFPLNESVDFSAGWQDREYNRRIIYRMKQNDRLTKVRNYQDNLKESYAARKAKFEVNSALSLHQYPSVTLSECLDMDLLSQNRSRSSSPFFSTPSHPPSTPITPPGRTHSTSSFYAYKVNLEIQTKFRVNNKRDVKLNSRVSRNSRCNSAPAFRGFQNRYTL